jgi:UDP-N-acetylglucosamine--N-acetylmuramyl-(pentapeptide) pyrophosphoryl-undecaprenol N-acetylglucosamine transferase
MNTRVVICGGHLTPALAVVDALITQFPLWSVYFFGRKFAAEGDSHISEEYRIVTHRKIPFITISAGRLTRRVSILSFFSVAKIPVGFIQAMIHLIQIRPDCVLSFGGYVALPVVIAARLLGIPVLTHEQTHSPGLANRIISKVAKKVLISFPDHDHVFPDSKTECVGLPLRTSIFYPPKKSAIDVPSGEPIIYITGGATGAVSLNKLIFSIVPMLVKKYIVVHQTGTRSLEEAQVVKKTLRNSESFRYIPVRYLDSDDHAWMLHRAKLVVCRSGANTVVELAVLGKVAVCVPLPWSAGREQQKNAEWLAAAGSARVVSQEDTDAIGLYGIIEDVMKKYRVYLFCAEKFSHTTSKGAAERIVRILDEMCNKS